MTYRYVSMCVNLVVAALMVHIGNHGMAVFNFGVFLIMLREDVNG